MGCFGTILLFIFLLGLLSGQLWAWIIVIVLVGTIIYGIVAAKRDADKMKLEGEKRSEEYKKVLLKYQEWLEEIDIPQINSTCMFTKKSSYCQLPFINTSYTIFKKDDQLKFIISPPDLSNYEEYYHLSEISIPLEDIEYFAKQGEVYRENRISGGGGGGSSVKGAIVGSIIAGDAGAVIGSRKKVEEVRSQLVTHDTRETFINYFQDNTRISLFFDVDSYISFNDVIPEKEFSIVEAVKSQQLISKELSNNNAPVDNIIARLEKLKSLKESGLISDEEYRAKKEAILNEI